MHWPGHKKLVCPAERVAEINGVEVHRNANHPGKVPCFRNQCSKEWVFQSFSYLCSLFAYGFWGPSMDSFLLGTACNSMCRWSFAMLHARQNTISEVSHGVGIIKARNSLELWGIPSASHKSNFLKWGSLTQHLAHLPMLSYTWMFTFFKHEQHACDHRTMNLRFLNSQRGQRPKGLADELLQVDWWD